MDFKEKLEGSKEYFREVYTEARRVTWPSKKDAIRYIRCTDNGCRSSPLFSWDRDVGLAKVIQHITWINQAKLMERRWKRSGMWCIRIPVTSRE